MTTIKLVRYNLYCTRTFSYRSVDANESYISKTNTRFKINIFAYICMFNILSD